MICFWQDFGFIFLFLFDFVSGNSENNIYMFLVFLDFKFETLKG